MGAARTQPGGLIKKRGEKTLIGQTLENRYVVEKLIGRGSMGSVYKGIDRDLRSPVAIKTFDPSVYVDPDDACARFVREAQALRSIKHPNVVKVISLGRDEDDHPYMVMDFIEGMTLEDYIRERGQVQAFIPRAKGEQQPSRALSLTQALGLIRPIAEAIRAVHARLIIHRDLKTGNINVAPPDEEHAEERPIILDFGLAKANAAAPLTTTDDGATQIDARPTAIGQVMGTPQYMHPLQFLGRAIAPTDRFYDVYALACIFYEMLVGFAPYEDFPVIRDNVEPGQVSFVWMYCHHNKAPFPFTPITELRPDLSAYALDAFFQQALAREPGESFRTVDEFLRALDQALKPAPVSVSLPPPKRAHFILGGTAFLLTCLVLVALVHVTRVPSTSPPNTRQVVVQPPQIAVPPTSLSVSLVPALPPPDATAVPMVVVDAGRIPAEVSADDAGAVVADRPTAHRPRTRSHRPRCGYIDSMTQTRVPCL